MGVARGRSRRRRSRPRSRRRESCSGPCRRLRSTALPSRQIACASSTRCCVVARELSAGCCRRAGIVCVWVAVGIAAAGGLLTVFTVGGEMLRGCATRCAAVLLGATQCTPVLQGRTCCTAYCWELPSVCLCQLFAQSRKAARVLRAFRYGISCLALLAAPCPLRCVL